ncbi:hypothetical protein TYRP_023792 [Tyrophagus putrescentiae]|nr:hypothetical protein TYRP_023792 [Tyrophagus putrescentiae]
MSDYTEMQLSGRIPRWASRFSCSKCCPVPLLFLKYTAGSDTVEERNGLRHEQSARFSLIMALMDADQK